VVSGQTVLLAGLISEKQQNGRSGIPILGRIPVLGDLVSQTDNGSARTELVVFIRPVVIRSGEDARSCGGVQVAAGERRHPTATSEQAAAGAEAATCCQVLSRCCP